MFEPKRDNGRGCTSLRGESTRQRNEYAEVKHVVVVGALQYSHALNEAMARAAAGLTAQQRVSRADVEKLRLGEIAHHLFQAVGRGAVQKSFEGDCPPGCHLWITFSSYGKAAVPTELLMTTFPGARLEEWLPVKPPLKKSEAAFIDAIESCLRGRQEATVGLEEIGDQAGYSWNTVMRRLDEPKVIDELRRRAIEGASVTVEARTQAPQRLIIAFIRS